VDDFTTCEQKAWSQDFAAAERSLIDQESTSPFEYPSRTASETSPQRRRPPNFAF
jgi:hypothetical protein